MRRRSILFDTVVRIVAHTVLLVSLFLLFSGHNAPGGGFAGGLVASCMLVLRYLADDEPTRLHAVPPEVIMGSGVMIGAVTGAFGWLWGNAFLDAAEFEITIPAFGEITVGSVLAFDIGVYVTIIGFVLMILRILGDDDLQELA